MEILETKKFNGKVVLEDSAVSSIEYALLASLISIFIFGSIELVGEGVLSLWSQIQTCLALAISHKDAC